MDIVARWGGEEFVVMVTEAGRAAARVAAEKIRVRAEQAGFDFAGVPVRLTVSIGIAEWQAGEPLESLLERTDKALYAARRGGRNRVCDIGSADPLHEGDTVLPGR